MGKAYFFKTNTWPDIKYTTCKSNEIFVHFWPSLVRSLFYPSKALLLFFFFFSQRNSQKSTFVSILNSTFGKFWRKTIKVVLCTKVQSQDCLCSNQTEVIVNSRTEAKNKKYQPFLLFVPQNQTFNPTWLP